MRPVYGGKEHSIGREKTQTRKLIAHDALRRLGRPDYVRTDLPVVNVLIVPRLVAPVALVLVDGCFFAFFRVVPRPPRCCLLFPCHILAHRTAVARTHLLHVCRNEIELPPEKNSDLKTKMCYS